MNFTPKKILYHVKSAPFKNQKVREMLELILMMASYHHEITLLFMDDGVLQLIPHECKGLKSVTPLLKALAHYDINEVYVCRDSLLRHQIKTQDLVLPAKPVTQDEINNLLHEMSIIF